MTKNIYIRDNQFGFTVYNNKKAVGFAKNLTEAENIAKQISDTKGIIYKGEYFTMTIRKAWKSLSFFWSKFVKLIT